MQRFSREGVEPGNIIIHQPSMTSVVSRPIPPFEIRQVALNVANAGWVDRACFDAPFITSAVIRGRPDRQHPSRNKLESFDQAN